MNKEEFKIILEPEFYEDMAEDFDNGNLLYNPWTNVYIKINDNNFFKEECLDPKLRLGTGLYGPLYVFIEQLISLPYELNKEGKVLYTDPEEQIYGALVFEKKGEHVIIADIDDNNWYKKEGIWYDGEKLVYSLLDKVPMSKNNVVGYDAFKKGCIEGVEDVLSKLVLKYPQIEYTSGYRNLKENFKKYKDL
ncbi:hypothetical protein ACOAKC_08975 [Hathewaya histolytica]|uniref:hypothetical protein n=1 Tax=Hathewaya histolytica TaxID=1498 RepID=UPI003B675845